jgi:arylsulfatase
MQASNTPFIHSKRTSHGGGVRAPLIISWPRGIRQHGIRHQFHHVTDIAPTLMEILGIALPGEYEGRVIKPMEGTSMVYSFDDPDAEARKTEQYYEIEGRRAYYDSGWKIISYREPEQEFDEAPWELYNLAEDFSESNDLAAEYPEKVEAIEKKWWEAARAYHVLPIIDVPLLERPMYTRHWLERGPGHFEYRPGMSTIQRFRGPILPNHSFTITATIDRADESREGVLAALGDLYSGYTFYIKDNRLHFELNVAYEVKKLVSEIEIAGLQYRGSNRTGHGSIPLRQGPHRLGGRQGALLRGSRLQSPRRARGHGFAVDRGSEGRRDRDRPAALRGMGGVGYRPRPVDAGISGVLVALYLHRRSP